MQGFLRHARRLDFDAGFLLCVIAIGALCAVLLYFAEQWGAARARRRTAHAMAEVERLGPPEVRT
jgi:hypothetical protein